MDESDQLSHDLGYIKDIETEKLRELIALVLEFLLSPANSDFQSILGSFAESVRVSASVLKALVRGLLVFLHGGMKDGWSVSELRANCDAMSISSESTNVIAGCWAAKAGQMATSLLSRTIKANQLVDMDWSFGVTAASDDCDHVGKTYLQLKFTIDSADSGLRDVLMELSLEQFFQFLAQMENCKSYLDFLDSA